MIEDRIAATFAALLAIAFMGFMAWQIGAVALGIITAGVLAMMIVDFVQTLRGGRT